MQLKRAFTPSTGYGIDIDLICNWCEVDLKLMCYLSLMDIHLISHQCDMDLIWMELHTTAFLSHATKKRPPDYTNHIWPIWICISTFQGKWGWEVEVTRITRILSAWAAYLAFCDSPLVVWCMCLPTSSIKINQGWYENGSALTQKKFEL